MTDYVNSWPTAQKRHRCAVCDRPVLPGETYWRQAGLARSSAWTTRTCEHCERVIWAYNRAHFSDEWDGECVLDWLYDEHPAVYVEMRSGWRWPDGESLPLPFGPTCIDCGAWIEFRHLWCRSCDDRRIARLNRQFAALAGAFEDESR